VVVLVQAAVAEARVIKLLVVAVAGAQAALTMMIVELHLDIQVLEETVILVQAILVVI
jgi:hypothetical protein